PRRARDRPPTARWHRPAPRRPPPPGSDFGLYVHAPETGRSTLDPGGGAAGDAAEDRAGHETGGTGVVVVEEPAHQLAGRVEPAHNSARRSRAPRRPAPRPPS